MCHFHLLWNVGHLPVMTGKRRHAYATKPPVNSPICILFLAPSVMPSNKYPYTNAVPPPECICHLFPPSTRPHIYSPTNSEDGEEEGSEITNTAFAAAAAAQANATDTAVVQPARRGRINSSTLVIWCPSRPTWRNIWTIPTSTTHCSDNSTP